jgi:hypothetical protein
VASRVTQAPAGQVADGVVVGATDDASEAAVLGGDTDVVVVDVEAGSVRFRAAVVVVEDAAVVAVGGSAAMLLGSVTAFVGETMPNTNPMTSIDTMATAIAKVQRRCRLRTRSRGLCCRDVSFTDCFPPLRQR